MRACGPSTGPTACALAGRRCSLWGWRKGVPGGVPSTVVRGAWCQALPLPRPLVLRSVQPGFRDPCVPGAVDAGVWTQHRPHSVRPCGPALLAVGVAEGRPRGGAFHRCEGRLVSGAAPPPAARPPERAARVPRPVCPGCGRCGRVDPAPAPQRAPLRAGVARCGGGGRASPGGAAFHRCEGRLVPGAVPPPAARPPERAARVLRPVCPGCGRCGRGGPAPAPQRAPLRAGVARCGDGGRASPGGLPSTMVRGAWGQALSLSRLPAHCRVGCRGRWVCAVCVVSVPCVSWCVVLLFPWSSGAPLSGVSVRCCARRVPAVSPPLCAPLARPLATPCSFRGFVALYPFLYSSPWHALFPCLRFVACLCLFPCRPGLPLLNLRRERRVRKQACGGGGFVATRHLELAGTSCDMRVRPACA